MPSYIPPKKNTAYVIYIALPSVANSTIFQANPTLASGDFKVSIDGGTLANLATLPTVTPASGKMVKISLSTSEMNGDNITVVCSDAAGAEWQDVVINIQTSAQQIDDLATQASVNTIDDFVDTEIADIQARLPAALVSGRIDASVGAMATGVVTAGAVAADAIGASELATDAVTEIADGIWNRLTSAITTGSSIGKLLVDNINATISSRASQTSVDVVDDFLDTEIAAIKAKTDNLPAAPAAVGDIPTAAAIADAVLDEAMVEPTATFAWAGATLRTVVAWLGALSRNKMTQTVTTSTLRNDADSGTISTSTVADAAGTFTRGEFT